MISNSTRAQPKQQICHHPCEKKTVVRPSVGPAQEFGLPVAVAPSARG
jgi:hypothetical protein